MSKKPRPKIIAVLGPTASGKSDLAVHIARKYNGEIISVDSRQVYRGLDIGTGKITKTQMKGIPHHLLDVANPRKVFTASDFVTKGERALFDILQKGKVPILAGGTGFYLSALLGEISLPNVKPNKALRTSLEKFSLEQLQEKLQNCDPERAQEIDVYNARRLIRALEIADALGATPKSTKTSLYATLKIGINTEIDVLEKRINTRLLQRLRQGMLAEARHLHTKGLSWKRMEELGLEYRYMARHLQGKLSKQEMIDELKVKTRQYAKRQRTWLKRDTEIVWFTLSHTKKIEKSVSQFLAP